MHHPLTSSIGYISILLFLLFYLYSVTGTFLFGGNDPLHFGSLQKSLLTLFGTVTLEGWVDLMYVQIFGCDKWGYEGIEALCTAPKGQPVIGPLFFVSFILVGTMIILNLFIGVIMNGMDEARKEAEEQTAKRARETPPVLAGRGLEENILAMQAMLEDLRQRLEEVKRKLGERQ